MNANQIVARVRELAYIPTTTAFTDQKIIDSVNSEMHLSLTPAILRASGELLTETVDIPLVSGTAGYELPTRTMLSTVRQVCWVDGGGFERPNLVRLELSQVFRYSNVSGDPLAFHLTATQIVLHPTPTTAGYLRLRYSHRMSDLVLDAHLANTESTAVGHVLGRGYPNFPLGCVKLSFITDGWPWIKYDISSGAPLPEATGTPAAVDVTSCLTPHKLYLSDIPSAPVTGDTSLVQLSQGGVGVLDISTATIIVLTNNIAGTVLANGPFPLAVSIFNDGDTTVLRGTGIATSCDFDGMRWILHLSGAGVAGAAADDTIWPTASVIDVTSNIQVGDFLTFAGTSYVPQCPQEWHELLCMQGAARMAMLRKDFGLRQQILEQAVHLERELINASQPRTKQNSKFINAWAGNHRSRYKI